MIARAYCIQRCKPFQTFQALEMDAGAKVLNFPSSLTNSFKLLIYQLEV
jgi:hypothetical protein